MSFSRISPSFNFLITFTLLQAVLGLDPLFHICSNSGQNFSANSIYEENLDTVMRSLNVLVPGTGFGLASSGWSPNQVRGLGLCRGDVSTTLCHSCVVEASNEIRKSCPFSKTAIIWYDHCFLKYSNEQFFSRVDDKNKFALLNTQIVSDPPTFNQKTNMLLGKLANETIETSNYYAAGEMELSDEDQSKKLYGMSQCTRDLPKSNCKKCLDKVIGELPSCCDGRQGGRVVTGSCSIRYDIYPFRNV